MMLMPNERLNIMIKTPWRAVDQKERLEPFLFRLRRWVKEFWCVVVGHKKPRIIEMDIPYWIGDTDDWPVGTQHKWTCERCGRNTRS